MLRLWMKITSLDNSSSSIKGFETLLTQKILGHYYTIFASAPKSCLPKILISDAQITIKVSKFPDHSLSQRCNSQEEPLIHLNCHSGDLKIFVPLTTITPLFYLKHSEALYISSDVRLLFQLTMQIDECGIYSLFQFGAIVPPFSPWQEIKRFVPGKQAYIRGKDLHITETQINFWETEANCPISFLETNHQEQIITETLDKTLERMCPEHQPVIMFSGGVDSGLLAARAAAMGWKDTLLVNYRMGKDDPEAHVAEMMAKKIGLPFISVSDDFCSLKTLLDSLGESYIQPFGDHSVIPTYFLIQNLLKKVGNRRIVLDGTGADGALGLFGKLSGWQKIYAIPEFIRFFASLLYNIGDLWKNENQIEYYLRLLKRSQQMPLLLASIAPNPLCGIAYDFPQQTQNLVFGAIQTWIESTLTSLSPKSQYSGIDIIHTCCGIFAQKSASLFTESSVNIAFPFLSPDFVRLALQSSVYWTGSMESKAVLKRILTKQFPHSMVYRQKSGFVAPMKNQFKDKIIISSFNEYVFSHNNPIRDFLQIDTIKKILKLVAQDQQMPPQTYNFMWNILFTTLWLKQVKEQKNKID